MISGSLKNILRVNFFAIGVGQSDANLRELAMVLFSPFKAHVAKYGSYESNLLAAELTGANATPVSKDIIDELRNVALSVQRLVAVFQEASKRCCDLTEGNVNVACFKSQNTDIIPLFLCFSWL